ncbi:MAG: nitroreductase family deazaflavin-dependent oxidoreductase [Anaerolineales bacterium]|uniref:Nitroreductase family deazaflavin-dependent oxidoreductase n=1 Tax=Candidatus Desulfolinea nitratireducens TaxID=2841698 RepID=A0A8J6NHK0_9CHLR|nr:nitroreductase family deazaflavin-dependent oxidoreductase [Candidatus Desulfolinea nitratireducens]MBL6960400.1 nitroreductase family deazaflavin-dependent oxidoreductase [Anaerolineales bacterium]
MSRMTGKPMRERPLLRAFMRFPIYLYRARLGWLFGERFLMLSHTGRKSGIKRYVVLEVVNQDDENKNFYVAAAWGKKADWYRNILVTPKVTVQVKNQQYSAYAEKISPEAALENLWAYAQKYPAAFTQLIKTILGESLPPDYETCQKMAEAIPLVALKTNIPA